MVAGRHAGWLLWLAIVPLHAQSPPTFRSSTNLVEATTIVRDAQGHAIGDLTVDDFQLFDNGKPQVISRFSVERSAIQKSSSLSAPHTPAAAGRPDAATRPSRFVACVLDDLNLIAKHFPQAAIAAIRYLPELQPGDRVSVVSASGRTILPFTADREKLRSALSNMGSLGRSITFDVSGLNSDITCQITYLKADWILRGDTFSLRNCVAAFYSPPKVPSLTDRPTLGGISPSITGEIRQIRLENQVRAFAESIVQAGDRDVQSYFTRLAELISNMSTLPGERSILLLSPGMYIAPRFRPLQNRIIDAAVRAHVHISAVDPRGVIANDEDDPSTWPDAWGIAETNERNGFMEDVTSATGGRFVRGNNDIDAVIRRLQAVPEYVYVLGFSPAASTFDGKYHTLKVSLTHRHGLTVDVRRGYYAVDANAPAPAETDRQIESALFSSLDQDTIPLQLRIRSSHTPGKDVLTASTYLDLRNVAFRKDEAVNRSTLTLVVGLFDENGGLMKDVWKQIDLHPDDHTLASLRESGIEVSCEFDVRPGRYLVRSAVRDGQGQGLGAHSAWVTIQP